MHKLSRIELEMYEQYVDELRGNCEARNVQTGVK